MDASPSGDSSDLYREYCSSGHRQHRYNSGACEALSRVIPLQHGNAIYIFDGKGRARLIATAQSSGEGMLHDIRKLVHEQMTS
jgi:hypothetical protein